MCNGNAGVDAGGAEVGLGALLTATGYGAAAGVPLILGGAGTATNAYAQNQQLKKQNDTAAQGIIQQDNIQQHGSNDAKSAIQSVAQSTAKTQAAQASQLSAYRAALQQGSGISQSASPNVPGSSKAYKQEQGSSGASAQNYVNALAGDAATTEGTQLERVGENQTLANTATQMGALQNQSNEQNYLTKLKIQSTQANPWLTGLGTLLSAAGAVSGAAGSAGAAAGDAGAAEDAAEGVGAGGAVAANQAPGGVIDLDNALTGLSGEAQAQAGASSAAAGLGSVNPSWLASTLSKVQSFGAAQNAAARRAQVTSPFMNGGQ